MFTGKIRSTLTCLAFALLVGSLFFQTDADGAWWEFYTGETGGVHGVPGSPAVGDDGTVYVGSLNGYFYAINPDGTQKWKYPADKPGAPFGYTPAIGPDGTVYAGAGRILYAFNPDGTVRSSYSADCLFLGAPAIEDDGTVYMGSNSSKLYAFNSDLTLKWSYPIGFEGWVSNPVIGSDGTVYFKGGTFTGSSSPQNRIFAVDRYGDWKWDWSLESENEAPPAIGRDGTIYYTDGLKLHAVDQSGHWKWDFEADYNTTFTFHSSPAIGADKTIYVSGWDVGTNHGIIFAVNPDGSRKWALNHWESNETGFHAPPAVGADGLIYFGSMDTEVYRVVDHGTWATLAVLGDTEGQVHSSPAIWYDGTLYYGCSLSVKANETTSYGPANSSWPMFRGNLKRTAKVKPWVLSKGLLELLRKLVLSYNLSRGIEHSLVSKLDSADRSLEKDHAGACVNKLRAFVNEVSALGHKKIPRREADNLIMKARRIISSLMPVHRSIWFEEEEEGRPPEELAHERREKREID